jgi:Na+/H+-translocating membrane pyrophosphatase
VATYANTRTAVAAEKGLNDALTTSFMSGSIMVRKSSLNICFSGLVFLISIFL